MYDTDQLAERARQAKDKKAALGQDIDMSRFEPASPAHAYLAQDQLCTLPEADQKQFTMSGWTLRKMSRGGTFIMKDTSTIHCGSRVEGVEVMPIRQALEHHEWLRGILLQPGCCGQRTNTRPRRFWICTTGM